MKIAPNISDHRPVSHGGLFSIKDPKPDILDFSSNISPLGSSPLVRKTIKNQVKNIEIYPDSNSSELRDNLSWYTKIPANQIVVGNGATELIYNFCHAFFSKGTKVVIPIPTFGEYEAAARLSGAKVSFVKTMNLNDDFDALISKIPKNGYVFVCNPNNPTGILIPRKKMLMLIQSAKKKETIVFVDESFIELVPDFGESVAKDVKKYENLFVLRSMTKSFGLAGVRIGYGLGSKKITSILDKIKNPWNVSGLAQKAAGAALCDLDYLDKARNIIRKESKFLQSQISKINGFECQETTTNFILIKTKMKSKTIQEKLLKKKILIRDCSTFHGLDDHFIRIAVKRRKENLKLVKALEQVS